MQIIGEYQTILHDKKHLTYKAKSKVAASAEQVNKDNWLINSIIKMRNPTFNNFSFSLVTRMSWYGLQFYGLPLFSESCRQYIAFI